MNINELTLGQIKEIQSLLGGVAQPVGSNGPAAWVVGRSYLIRTVTQYLTGHLEAVYDQELVLSDAAWVACTGRFAAALKTGKLEEVEPYPDGNVIVGRGAITDAGEWVHALPREVIE